MTRKPPRQQVRRIKPTGDWPARVFRIHPDPDFPRYHVEVRVHRTAAHIHREHQRLDGRSEGSDWAGLCRTWHARRLRAPGVARPRGLIARIYLDATALQRRPGEIVTHECGHAAMGWARFRRANLGRMPGEEVMCYALGRLVAQANHHLYALGVF